MKPFQKTLATLIGFVMITSLQAMAADQSAPMSLKRIDEETAALNDAKNLVLQRYQKEVKSCWQLFAVNDCLAKAKREKYQRLAPIEQLELTLNTQRRALKEADRIQRLNDKSSAPEGASQSVKAAP
jgi:hypothetical protein